MGVHNSANLRTETGELIKCLYCGDKFKRGQISSAQSVEQFAGRAPKETTIINIAAIE